MLTKISKNSARLPGYIRKRFISPNAYRHCSI